MGKPKRRKQRPQLRWLEQKSRHYVPALPGASPLRFETSRGAFADSITRGERRCRRGHCSRYVAAGFATEDCTVQASCKLPPFTISGLRASCRSGLCQSTSRGRRKPDQGQKSEGAGCNLRHRWDVLIGLSNCVEEAPLKGIILPVAIALLGAIYGVRAEDAKGTSPSEVQRGGPLQERPEAPPANTMKEPGTTDTPRKRRQYYASPHSR